MSAFCRIASIGAVFGGLVFAANVQAQDAGGEFSGARFTCLQYTNGLGASSSTKAQTELARMWIHGYLAGYYKAQNKLEMTDSASDGRKLNNLVEEKCKANPQVAIMTVAAQAIAVDKHGIPKAVNDDFSPSAYTCGQHVDAKGGAAADANRADLAEMWAFAFVQGYKNVGAPNLEIPIESKVPIIGAVNKSCAANRGTLYMDLAALVAEKVKLN